jgi:TP901 family phage tail tape measure protein
LAEVAILYKNVGDNIDVEEANSSLVSTLQGFQMDAKDAIKIVDSFNEVANNYAINSDGIGEALKRSAAAFNAANTDLNQSIALITAGNEIVQSPEKVGKYYANLYSNVLIIKVAISVKSQRWSRPR